MTEQSTNRWKSRAIVTGIFLLFFLPILGSWYLVFFTDYKHGGGGVQHGILINPPRQLEDVELFDLLSSRTGKLHGKWTMLMIVASGCDQACTDNLYRLRQLQLAMGKDMHRLQRAAWFMDKTVQQDAGRLFAEYAGQTLLSPANGGKDFLSRFMVNGKFDNHAIYLIDPAGFLMMAYPADTKPSGIIKDLKRLLRNSKMD